MHEEEDTIKEENENQLADGMQSNDSLSMFESDKTGKAPFANQLYIEHSESEDSLEEQDDQEKPLYHTEIIEKKVEKSEDLA